jgi:replicative DNA helicase
MFRKRFPSYRVRLKHVDLVKTLLSDLRESGAIEQDADIVVLYRPEYYKIDEWDDDEASPTQVKQK